MHAQETQMELASGQSPMVDTTFVLFFLGIDFGQSLVFFEPASVFSGLTLVMLVALPYFMPAAGEKPRFGTWVFGRTVIATLAVAVGLIFSRSLGVVLPEMFRFLPLTLLIAAAMVSCYIQFYGIMRFRLAR